jgi:hypothetical protein
MSPSAARSSLKNDQLAQFFIIVTAFVFNFPLRMKKRAA